MSFLFLCLSSAGLCVAQVCLNMLMLPAQQATPSGFRSEYTHHHNCTYMYVACWWCNWALAARLIACAYAVHGANCTAGQERAVNVKAPRVSVGSSNLSLLLWLLWVCVANQRRSTRCNVRVQLRIHVDHALSTQAEQEPHYHTNDNIADI